MLNLNQKIKSNEKLAKKISFLNIATTLSQLYTILGERDLNININMNSLQQDIRIIILPRDVE